MFENQFKNEEEKKYFTDYLIKRDEMLAENFDEIKTINLLSVGDENSLLKE